MSSPVKIPVQVLPHGKIFPLPEYATSGSAGMDLRAAIEKPETLAPGERKLIPTGLAMEIPAGFEAQIRPRSGLAIKHGITMLNSPGTIDSDYRGEVRVILANLGQEPFTIQPGDRIAQIIFSPVIQAAWEPKDSLTATARHEGGFGHTGKA
jgi:dUTP pyrophosphatase